MPLPSVVHHHALQCRAKSKRSQQRCKNPAAFGMPVCRFHGARRALTVLRGLNHPNYRHGEETLEQKMARSRELATLATLEQQLYELGMTTLTRTPGRRPTGSADQ